VWRADFDKPKLCGQALIIILFCLCGQNLVSLESMLYIVTDTEVIVHSVFIFKEIFIILLYRINILMLV
jgi:hypothetical protein